MELIPEEWFKLIDDSTPYWKEVKERALANVRNPNRCDAVYLDIKSTSPNKAIFDGFFWDRTPEGEEYWDEIHKNPIPLLPCPAGIEAQKAKDRELLIEFAEWGQDAVHLPDIYIEDFLTEKYKTPENGE